MFRSLIHTATVVALVLMSARAPLAAQGSGTQAEGVFSEAEALLRLGRTEQARERYQRIVDEFPAGAYPELVWRAAARVRLADIRWRSTGGQMAGAEYLAVLEQEPSSPWISRARLGLARVSLVEGDWESAADLLERIVMAADGGAIEADTGAAEEAGRRLTLIDRFRLRPLLGEGFWSRAETMPITGVQLKRPVAVAAADDGQVLVIDEGMPAVLLIGAGDNGVSQLTYNEHTRPWWGVDGLPYLPTRKAGVIALGGSRVGFLASEGGRPVPLKALVAGSRTGGGRWYLLDADPHRVLRFGADGDYQGLASEAGERPIDVAVDPSGRLLMLESEGKAVVRLLPDGRREGIVARGQWRRPQALAVDGLGNFYVLDRDARTIDVFDPDGTRLARLGPTLPGGFQLRSPRDLSVDGEGRIYIADRSASAVVVVQ